MPISLDRNLREGKERRQVRGLLQERLKVRRRMNIRDGEKKWKHFFFSPEMSTLRKLRNVEVSGRTVGIFLVYIEGQTSKDTEKS